VRSELLKNISRIVVKLGTGVLSVVTALVQDAGARSGDSVPEFVARVAGGSR